MSELVSFISQNWLPIVIGGGVLFLVLLWFFWPRVSKKPRPNFIFCPLRNKYFPKYDSFGSFTEEYQRIRLIAHFLHKGYSKSSLKCEYPLEKQFGHKGHSRIKIQVDLVIKKGNKILVVAEVKKNYHPEKRRSAIEHQLKPAMDWTNAKFGVYWDGSSRSCLLTWKSDRTFAEKPFSIKK